MPISRIKDFMQHEASGGLVLMAAAIVALLSANIPGTDQLYQQWTQPIIKLVVNDAVMAIFFLLVGLELKRECLIGELSGRDRILQPLFAAVGGMVVPVMIYLICTKADPLYRSGWAIPAATDIAFALGIISLLGSRIPKEIKVLLTALAILDDIGAIAVIAVFYSHGLAVLWLLLAVCAMGVLYALNRRSVSSLLPYLLCGCIVWIGFLKGGLHPTLAGVATAMFIPLRSHDGDINGHAPLYRLEHALHGFTAFVVLPVFAFVNAGLSVQGLSLVDITRPVTLGVLVGLCIGKPLGVLGGLWVGQITGLLRSDLSLRHAMTIAMACLCGIGFTMSLFINDLAFSETGLQNQAKLGVLLASVLAAIVGLVIGSRSRQH